MPCAVASERSRDCRNEQWRHGAFGTAIESAGEDKCRRCGNWRAEMQGENVREDQKQAVLKENVVQVQHGRKYSCLAGSDSREPDIRRTASIRENRSSQ
jgi:hypothetical protein